MMTVVRGALQFPEGAGIDDRRELFTGVIKTHRTHAVDPNESVHPLTRVGSEADEGAAGLAAMLNDR